MCERLERLATRDTDPNLIHENATRSMLDAFRDRVGVDGPRR